MGSGEVYAVEGEFNPDPPKEEDEAAVGNVSDVELARSLPIPKDEGVLVPGENDPRLRITSSSKTSERVGSVPKGVVVPLPGFDPGLPVEEAEETEPRPIPPSCPGEEIPPTWVRPQTPPERTQRLLRSLLISSSYVGMGWEGWGMREGVPPRREVVPLSEVGGSDQTGDEDPEPDWEEAEEPVVVEREEEIPQLHLANHAAPIQARPVYPFGGAFLWASFGTCAASSCVAGIKMGALNTSARMDTIEGKFDAAPVQMRRVGVGPGNPPTPRPSGIGLRPSTPEEATDAQRTRKPNIWLSTRHLGFARRSRNSCTLTPVSKRYIPLTCEKGYTSPWRW